MDARNNFSWGEYWARRNAVGGSVADGDELNALNQAFAYHPWAVFRNTPGFVYSPDETLKVVKINKYGWRGPEPAISRQKNIRRALLLGDSVPFSGWGCREGVTLGGALKRALDLRSGEEWEVINTATGAGFSSMSLAMLAHEGLQFNPDVIVSFNGTNDLLVLEPDFQYTTLGKEGNIFKHVLYHAIQEKFQNIYDPRTDHYNPRIIVDQVISHSELLKRLIRLMEAYQQRARPAVQTAVPGRGNPLVPSRNGLEMSYIAAGAGVPFIAFLQPYLSLEHKVVGGDIDRAVIKRLNDGMPALLPWLDAVYPALRGKLAAAAKEHPSLQFVDLSLMFTDEQVFADNAHIRCEDDGLSMPGNELIAARMGDEIIARVYQGSSSDQRRAQIKEGTPTGWSDQAYLDANSDVARLVAEGRFPNGYTHYIKIGFLSGLHSGFPSWDEKAYLDDNPDVARLVAAGFSPRASTITSN
jgi:hypothetical protein